MNYAALGSLCRKVMNLLERGLQAKIGRSKLDQTGQESRFWVEIPCAKPIFDQTWPRLGIIAAVILFLSGRTSSWHTTQPLAIHFDISLLCRPFNDYFNTRLVHQVLFVFFLPLLLR